MKALFNMKKLSFLGTLLVAVFLAGSLSAQVIPTNEWIRLYGSDCLLNGEPIPVGALIQAYDPDGVLCGEWVVTTAGEYGFMSVYHDDIYTPGVDEGADANDEITLKVNGRTPLLLGPDLPIWTKNGDPHEVDLSASQSVAASVGNAGTVSSSPSEIATLSFQLTNLGDGVDIFDLTALSAHGWTTAFGTSNPTIYLDPNQSIAVQVKVTVPFDALPSTEDSIALNVTSRMDASYTVTGKGSVYVVSTSAEDDHSSIIPEHFSLSQNFPNPFNPETVISYALQKSGHVRLEIYNVLGQSVDVLVDRFEDAGEYSVTWNTLSMGSIKPSGVYFYRLTVNDLTLTRKMLLMK